MRKRSNFIVCMKLVGLVKPLSLYVVFAAVMGIIGHLCATFITVFGVYAVLTILDFNIQLTLALIFIILVVLAVFRGILHYGEQACNHFIAFKLLALIRDKVFVSLRKLCPAKLECRDKGDLISLITSDIELLEVFYAHTISPIIIAFLMAVFMSIFIGSIHPILAFVSALAYLTVGVIIPTVVSKFTGNSGKNFRKKTGELSSFILDSLRGLAEIIQYGSGKERLVGIKEKTKELLIDEEKLKISSGVGTAFCNSIIIIFDLIMLICASLLFKKGYILFDGVLISVIAMMSSFGPFAALSNLGSGLQNTLAAGNRVIDILEEKPICEDITGKETCSFDEAEIENVSFSYCGDKVLSDLSIKIDSNSITGVVGRSGSGKSTLLKLMMRFWDVGEGAVKISKRDVRSINTSNLRNMESYVTQEVHLFHDSIRNNISVAKLDATDEEIMLACKKASLNDFIMMLPDGYNTCVGELGDTLSGGERQRIGLARAFLHDAPLMLLDEPTSNLDSLNEAIILKSISEQSEGKSIVLVSHRKSTMRIADNIYSVENGRKT